MSDMLNVRANFNGLKEMNELLLQLPNGVGRSVLSKAWRWALRPLRSGLRSAMPRESGEGRASIKIVNLRPGRGEAVRLAVGPTKKWYIGRMLELGTKYITAHRWAQPVFDSLWRVLIQRFSMGVSRSLMMLAKRLDRKARAGKLTPVDRRIIG